MAYEDTDVKTVEAIEKIKAILREHDLWAAMVVVSEERFHWLYHFEPSWSALAFNPQTGEVRFRAKRADFNSPEQHKRVVTLTSGAVIATRDAGAKMFADADKLVKVIEERLGVYNEYSDLQYPKPKGDH
jgi:hypothetical protein